MVREVAALREAVQDTRAERPFGIGAWVVLPDHLHCVWTLPEGDSDFPVRWGAIKSRFTRRVGFHPTDPASGRLPTGHGGVEPHPTRSASKVRKGDAGVWQRRYWEHVVRDEDDYRRCVEYCWTNPVKHGFAAEPREWRCSSGHRDNP